MTTNPPTSSHLVPTSSPVPGTTSKSTSSLSSPPYGDDVEQESNTTTPKTPHLVPTTGTRSTPTHTHPNNPPSQTTHPRRTLTTSQPTSQEEPTMIGRIRTLAVSAVTIGVALIPVAFIAAPAHATTPCYMTNGDGFGRAEFAAWYDGSRWDTSLSDVESVYAGCSGLWESGQGSWNGRVTQVRTWPRPDGGTTEMTFAKYANAPTWRAHDTARTHAADYSDLRVECEWPRPTGDSCTPTA